MTDDNTIRVGTSVNTSGLKAGMAAATDAVSRAVVDLKTQYDQLTARGKELRTVLSSKINPTALESVREEASQLALQQALLKAQLDVANKALKEQASIAAGLTPSLDQIAASEAAVAEESRQAALESAKLAEAREAELGATQAAADAEIALARAKAASTGQSAFSGANDSSKSSALAIVDLKSQYAALDLQAKELNKTLSSTVNPAGLEAIRKESAGLAIAQTQLSIQIKEANAALLQQQRIAAGLAPTEEEVAAEIAKVAEAEAAQAEEARLAALESAKLAAARIEQAEATAAATAAENGLASASGHSVTQMQAASAAIRSFEGAVPIRAVEKFVSMIPGVGAALQVAFPVIGALALIEVLERGTEQVIEFSHAFDVVYQAEQRALTEGTKLAKEFTKEIAEGQRAIEQEAERLHGKTYADSLKFGNKQLDVAAADRDITRIEGLIKAAQARINAGTSAPFTTTKGAVRPGLPNNDAKAAAFDIQRLSDELENAQQRKKNYLTEAKGLSAETTKSEVEDQKKLSEEQKRISAEAKRAYSEAETAARQANTNAMTDLETRATQEGIIGRALTLQKIALLSQEIAADHAYTDVTRQLSAERARLGAEAAAQGVQNFNKAQQLASASIAAFSAETRRANEAEAKYFDEMLKDRIKAEEKQLEADKAFLAEDSEIKTGNLQTQKVATQAQQQLAPPDLSLKALNPLGNSEAVDDLKATQAIDRQILAEKIQLQASLAAIDKESGNEKEYARDQQKLHQLQQQSSQQQIQQNLQLTQTMRAQWQSYFSIVNQGVTQGINGLISGNETFEQATRQMLVRLLEAFADYFAQKLMLSAENWLMDTIIGKTTQSTNAEMQVGSNAAVAGSAAFAATAAIPIVGPALAPEAAAATYAAVIGTYGPLATFETGGIVPSTGIALVHANEGVLTAPQTQWLQSAAQGGGGGNPVTVQQTNHYNEFTDASFKALASRNSDHLLNTVQKGMRRRNMV